VAKALKKTDAQKWLEKIKQAKKVKEEWRKTFRIDLAYEYRDGKQRPANIPSSDWMTINTIYSTLKAELPRLYANNPYFYIKLAKTYSAEGASMEEMAEKIIKIERQAQIRQDMLNYLKDEKAINLKETSRASILDAFFQFGVVKTHYAADIIDNPDAGKDILAEDEETVLGQEPDGIPINEQYQLTRIHPDDFLVDKDAGPLSTDPKWMAHRITRSLDDVKKDKRYDKAARTSVTPTEIEKDDHRKKKNDTDKSKDPDMVVLWEIYDIKNKEWLTVSDGSGKFLMKPQKLPPGVKDHPFSTIRLGIYRDDSWYPVPPVSQWLDPQKEKCQLRSKILTHRKRFNRKYEVWTGAFTDPDNAMEKLENGPDGTCLPKEQPGQAVFPISDAPLDQNHIQELRLIDGDFQELATGSNQRGTGIGIDSATEAGIIENRVNIREGDNLSLIRDFITDAGQKLDMLVQVHLTQPQAIRVTGPQGEFWQFVEPESYAEIEGDFSYSLNIGSTLPQLPEIERAQWMAFLGLIAQAPQLALSRSLLTKMAEMHHIEDEAMINEIIEISQKLMTGQLTPPGGQGVGSQPGQPDETTRAESAVGGMAAGINNIRGGQQ
jgi:hypothetical protein